MYRLWVLMTVLAAAGLLLYRVGLHKEAGIFQSAAAQSGDLFRVMVVGSLALVVVLAVSAIGSERGTVADSVLSRGISRHQYFLAKWHARLVVVTATFAALACAVLLASYLLFKDDTQSDLSLGGGLVAVLAVCAVLAAIVSWGVTIGGADERHRAGHHGVLAGAVRLGVPAVADAGAVAVAGAAVGAAEVRAPGAVQPRGANSTVGRVRRRSAPPPQSSG